MPKVEEQSEAKRYAQILKLGGFPTIESAIQALKELDDLPAKNKILTEAVKHLFNTVSYEDILKTKSDGTMEFMGKPLSEGQANQLRDEAKILVSLKLWRVLKTELRYQLNKKMFEESHMTIDLVWGKLILWYDDVIRTKLQALTGRELTRDLTQK
jgi:hypothetical protein